ncbi:MAG: hypothetical protein GY782_02515 [Gammaproteobacteria bacterium]|nr:hypothetical protein [Gammaproteobacteria bacterium]
MVKCNEQTKGYSLLNQTQELLNAEVPAARLKIIRGALDDKNKNPNTEVCEVDQIIGHRGYAGARQYLVKWKGRDEKTWENEEDFQTHDVIRNYWKELEALPPIKPRRGRGRPRGSGRGNGRGRGRGRVSSG